MKLIKKVWLPLAAAALTAVAFAAVSVAQNGDSDKGKKQGPDVAIASPGGPPMMFERLSEEDRNALEEFRSCLEDQGVEAPPEPPRLDEEERDGEPRIFKHRVDPPPEPPRLDEDEMPEPGTFEHRIKPPSEEERAKIEEAFKACEDKLPEGARQFGPHPCGPPPGAPEGEGAAIPAPPPSSGSQRS